MQNFMLNELKELCDRIKNYPADKTAGGEKIADTILDLVEYSIQAKKDGLLSLDNNLALEDMTDPVAAYKVEIFNLILDGNIPEQVEKLGLFRYIADGNENPFEAYAKLIILTAARSIQAGENPRLIENKLLLMVPAQLRFLCVKKFDDILPGAAPKSYEDLITVHFEEAAGSDTPGDQEGDKRDISELFEPVLMELTNRDIQQFLREAENKELRFALQGVGLQTAERIFRNMSENAGRMLIEEMDQSDMVPYVEVADSRKKLMGLLYDLHKAGEIVPDPEKCRHFYRFLEIYGQDQ